MDKSSMYVVVEMSEAPNVPPMLIGATGSIRSAIGAILERTEEWVHMGYPREMLEFDSNMTNASICHNDLSLRHRRVWIVEVENLDGKLPSTMFVQQSERRN